MKRLKKWFFLAVVAVALTYIAGLIQDNMTLQNDLVRLHVVANSDSPEDQAVKLQVRDAVVDMLEDAVAKLPTAQEARAYIAGHLQDIEDTANEVLAQAGSALSARVSLEKEAFPTRAYDTFSLPAGLYNALRVTIGEGEGQNWWCVLFPSLCVPASSDGFEEVAEAAGFPDNLNHTLTQENTGYQIRFRLLDWLGELQNLFNP